MYVKFYTEKIFAAWMLSLHPHLFPRSWFMLPKEQSPCCLASGHVVVLQAKFLDSLALLVKEADLLPSYQPSLCMLCQES